MSPLREGQNISEIRGDAGRMSRILDKNLATTSVIAASVIEMGAIRRCPDLRISLQRPLSRTKDASGNFPAIQHVQITEGHQQSADRLWR